MTTERAYRRYPGGSDAQRGRCDLLRRYMEEEGFAVYEWEWSHFDYHDLQSYAIRNVRFEEIALSR